MSRNRADYKIAVADRDTLDAEIAALPDQRAGALATLKTALAAKEAQLAGSDALIAATQATLDALAFDSDAHDDLANLLAAAIIARDQARRAVVRTHELQRGTKQAYDTAEAAIAAYDEQALAVADVASSVLTHDRTDKRLDEFRTAVASTIRPDMEELMSGFVAILTDGRHESVTLTEDFGVVVFEAGVATDVVSGGCEDIIALAMRLAISQMIAQRAGHPLSLLILDEPFGSLDETRRGSVIALIRRLRAVFSQVLVISHVAETRDFVDYAIELAYDEPAGMTRLVS